MTSSRPVAVSVLLAATVHAAVLGWGAMSLHGQAGSAVAGGSPLQARVMLEAPTPAPPVAQGPSAAAPESLEDKAPAAPPTRTGGDEADARPPRFAETPGDVGMPDAPMPADGVQVRAFLRLDEAGRPTDIATATWPADAAHAFGDQFKRALEGSRFEPEPATARRCLQMDFEAGTGQPRWSWVPGQEASAARCLGARAGSAKVITLP
ncbi:hypothetical protein ACG04Q_18595 [Roseateles sp. DXS20W]|uniref:TonB C-terminal domain-containing protein n=1 Tax=Pelomonas lactea TaxID=3299030 RepID=A0ABW7GPB5_9BURK